MPLIRRFLVHPENTLSLKWELASSVPFSADDGRFTLRTTAGSPHLKESVSATIANSFPGLIRIAFHEVVGNGPGL